MEEHDRIPPEVVDEAGRPLPVPRSDPRVVARQADTPLAAPVAAATGGIVAGVATMLLVRGLRSRPRRAVRIAGRKRKIDVAASRSFLVDVHVLKR